MARVIVTYGRGWNSLATVRSLGRRGIEVYCGEEAPFAPCFFSKYCRGHFQYPSPSREPDAFVDFMAEKVKELAPDGDEPYVLMPIHKETFVLAEHRERFEPHIKLPVTTIENIRLTDDKGSLARLAEQHGIRIPRTWQFHAVDELYRRVPDLPMPVFVKVRKGAAGVGLKKVNTPEELVTTFREFVDGFGLQPEQYPLVQEFVAGEDYCVTTLFNQGTCVASMTYHNIRSFPRGTGAGALRETVPHAEAEEAAVKLLSPLNWHGIAQVDFRIPKGGPPYLIEVNPRFFGGLAQCIAANVDYPYLLYQIAIGEPIDQSVAGAEIDYEKRTETPIVGLLATLEEIANDEAKLAELRAVADEFKRIPAADGKRRQFQRFLDQLKAVASPTNVRDYLRQMFEKHTDTINDVVHADDPLPGLGVLYPLALMVKHGTLSTAVLVSEQELPGRRPRKGLRDRLRPNWATLILTGVLFILSVVIDRFEPTRQWLGWLLGWPRHAAEAVGGQDGSGTSFAFYHILNFVYLYILSAVILWLRGRPRGRAVSA
ncbi:MAG TPA: ATP-grasp domain-containing protein [Phycisphaerae bacterium]|nr:ATP-grasp domain-containing protein [Phycisphaerae bacterium]